MNTLLIWGSPRIRRLARVRSIGSCEISVLLEDRWGSRMQTGGCSSCVGICRHNGLPLLVSVVGARNAVLVLGFPGPGLWACSRTLDLGRDLVYTDCVTVVLVIVTLGPRFACGAQADTTGGTWTCPAIAYPLPVSLQGPGNARLCLHNFRSVPGICHGVGWTHTRVIAGCSGDLLVDDFMEMAAMREDVPVACFYLVGAGSKVLRSGATPLRRWGKFVLSCRHGWSSSRRLFSS